MFLPLHFPSSCAQNLHKFASATLLSSSIALLPSSIALLPSCIALLPSSIAPLPSSIALLSSSIALLPSSIAIAKQDLRSKFAEFDWASAPFKLSNCNFYVLP